MLRYLSKVSYELNQPKAYQFALDMRIDPTRHPVWRRELLQMALTHRDFPVANQLSGGLFAGFHIPTHIEALPAVRPVMTVVDLRAGHTLVIVTNEICAFSQRFHQFLQKQSFKEALNIIQLAPQTDVSTKGRDLRHSLCPRLAGH